MLDAFWTAVTTLADPLHFAVLLIGVALGLVLGAVPGLGGVIGLSVLIPFVFDLSPTVSLVMLMGMVAVTMTSDSIPAILFGVPGTVAAQATVLDGHPMTLRGEAARALGASFTASALGGLFGAAVLLLSIPVVRPIVLSFGSPEFFMLGLLGITMVAALSRGALVKGLASGGLGILLSMVGQHGQTGVFRYVYDFAFLWEGLPVIVVALATFAIPELVDLAASGAPSTSAASRRLGRGRWTGVRDTLANWAGVLRSSLVGIYVGLIPGIGGSVTDWIAYAVARQTSRGAENFGHGDVRGVIAVDAASNAKEGGALVTTIAFGVPGSVTMALLITVFDMHGFAPGPTMLTTEVSVIMLLVLSLALANVFGAAACFAVAPMLARISAIRGTIIFALLIPIVFLGAYQDGRIMAFLMLLFAFGVVGWLLKHAGWPRPPLILGFVLGAKLEGALFLSIALKGAGWILQPIPLVLLGLCILSLWFGLKGTKRPSLATFFRRPRLTGDVLVAVLVAMTALYFALTALDWSFQARVMPLWVGLATFTFAILAGIGDIFGGGPSRAESEAGSAQFSAAVVPLAWIAGLLVATWAAGFLAATSLFSAGFLWIVARLKIVHAIALALCLIAVIWTLFGAAFGIRWPSGVFLDL